jgi:transcription antitermination factor NusG
MSGNVGQQQWYAIRVKPRHEKMVSTVLKNKGFDAFLPVYRQRRMYGRRLKELEFPLFDGYVFCKFDPLLRLPILMTPSVIYIVSNGQNVAPIAENEIAALQRAVDSHLALEPHEYLEIGDCVTITEGVLRGLNGILVKLKKSSLILSITLLRRSVAVEVDPASVASNAPSGRALAAAAGVSGA